jgi:hypothetical protein
MSRLSQYGTSPVRSVRQRARAFPLALMVGFLAAGCAGTPQAPTVTGSPGAIDRPTTNYFDYRIDSTIRGRYGTTGEVAWHDVGPGRPSILLLDEVSVTFQAGATPADIDRFAAAFDAVVPGPQVIPGTPDGAVPPRVTSDYRIKFRPENVSLAPLDAMLETTGVISGGWVFSSEAAAKTLLQVLRVKQQADQYKVAFIGFSAAMCVPEDCGPDGHPTPAYPSTEPRPTPTPTATPATAPMELKSVACLRSSIPLGKQGILRVTGILSASCRAVHEVKAIVDDERREVRLEATEKLLMEGCQTAVSYPETEVPFYPARLGTYRIIATVDGSGDKTLCEVEVVEHQ